MITLFVLATLLPYVAAGWLVGNDPRDGASTDRRLFEVVVLGTGLLYSI